MVVHVYSAPDKRPMLEESTDMPHSGRITFQCNICDCVNEIAIDQLKREEPSCTGCGSTVRMRSIIQILTTELFGKSLSISEISPVRPDIKGIGMSCWDGYALRLAHRVHFVNTYYHKEPRLDITDIPEDMVGTLDFITSTDVFEHVAPPVSVAFANARRLLKPDGVFVFSVPYGRLRWWERKTAEHFPNLHDYRIEGTGSERVLVNRNRSGEVERFSNLVFHGGEGSTLEMRVFTLASLKTELARAGFTQIRIYDKPLLKHGIHWDTRMSVPLAARIKRNFVA
jgi:2-polyprenyl-3-methyl-5-hydroxy-6-metoxy-1,4-benzoquinol methylase